MVFFPRRWVNVDDGWFCDRHQRGLYEIYPYMMRQYLYLRMYDEPSLRFILQGVVESVRKLG